MCPATITEAFFGKTHERQQAFHFESILSTEIAVQLEVYDLDSSTEHDLASLSLEERKAHQTKASAHAVITLQEKDSKKIVHTAAINSKGHYEGYINLAGHQQGDYNLGIHKPGYKSRKISIENLISYARIDRTIPMVSKASAKQTRATNFDTVDSDRDTIPDIYDAFPTDPSRAFQHT